MLTIEERSRLVVVLVGARNPGNIGAAARAMRDFGFADLRVVNEFAPPFEAAQLAAESEAERDAAFARAEASAIGAAEVLRNAQRFDDLGKALEDCTLVAATTAIGERELTVPVQTLQQIAPELREALGSAAADGGGRVALLFGSEKTGLTNAQLSHAGLLLTIPLFQPDGRHLSMNLGQAVAVCLYELVREGFDGSRELPALHDRPATEGDRERLLELFAQVLQDSGYSRRFPANARIEILRRFAGGMGRTQLEAGTWMGIFRQLQRWGKARSGGE